MKLKNTLLWALVLVLALLAGCQKSPAESTTTAPIVTEPPVEFLAVTVTEDNIGLLEQYPALKKLDLTGSTCYEAIAQYMQQHPKVEVVYTVKLGTVTVSSEETALVLDPGSCDYDTLAENLKYLPNLETVSLPRTTYTAQEVLALQGLYPDAAFDYTMIVLGQELTAETTELNLSVLEPERVADVAGRIGLFPNITKVELMDSQGQSQLSMDDVKLLQESAPNALFHYVFQLFGKTVSTTDERIEFIKEDIGNEGVEELRNALDILQGCQYFLLDGCGIDNETMAAIREDYRDRTKIVWRVWFGVTDRYTFLTDTDTIRAVYNVTDDTCGPMQYCEDVKYMDLGHNTELTDTSFIAPMTQLEIVILSGSPITDLTPFAEHDELVFLELAHCGYLKDVTPLATCDKLANINLSFTKVDDISSLYDLPLEQLCAVSSKIMWKDWQAILDRHPECAIRYEGTQPYGTGWRYKKSGAYTDIYAKVREVFQLDEVDKLIAAGKK